MNTLTSAFISATSNITVSVLQKDILDVAVTKTNNNIETVLVYLAPGLNKAKRIALATLVANFQQQTKIFESQDSNSAFVMKIRVMGFKEVETFHFTEYQIEFALCKLLEYCERFFVANPITPADLTDLLLIDEWSEKLVYLKERYITAGFTGNNLDSYLYWYDQYSL